MVFPAGPLRIRGPHRQIQAWPVDYRHQTQYRFVPGPVGNADNHLNRQRYHPAFRKRIAGPAPIFQAWPANCRSNQNHDIHGRLKTVSCCEFLRVSCRMLVCYSSVNYEPAFQCCEGVDLLLQKTGTGLSAKGSRPDFHQGVPFIVRYVNDAPSVFFLKHQ